MSSGNKKDITIPAGFKELLQEFTVAVLKQKPEDIVEFAIQHFTDLKMSGHRRAEPTNEVDLEEEEEDDDEAADELPPPSAQQQPRGRRRGVAAESFDPEKEDEGDQTRVVHPKSVEQKARLNLAVQNILLFRCLDDDQMVDVIDAMFERQVVPGEQVITLGEDGDNFYVIERGQYDIVVMINGQETKVGSYDNAGSFGELALMYNTPRAATIVAVDHGVLWAMTRETFRSIVLKKAFQKRMLYEALLEEVPLLKELSAYERMNVADALRTRVFEPNTKIIGQGEPGLEMYFVEEGSVRVTMRQGDGGEETEIVRLAKGKYFGELALLTKHPRAASVYALERTKLAVLDVGSFERLLGPCLSILQRNISDYEDKLKDVFGGNVPELRQ